MIDPYGGCQHPIRLR